MFSLPSVGEEDVDGSTKLTKAAVSITQLDSLERVAPFDPEECPVTRQYDRSKPLITSPDAFKVRIASS